MSILFFAEEEGTKRDESINNYLDLFSHYKSNPPDLDESLEQIFKSAGANDSLINDLIKDINTKCEEILERNNNEIKEKYPNISKDEAMIISSYTCESIDYKFNPYRILNLNLVSKNRRQGIANVSKYLYILLKSLRKLKRYYPDPEKKFLYRCIDFKVNLMIDPFNINLVPYIRGNTKTFWGFTSTSPNVKMTYNFLGKRKDIKSGTIFTLGGDVWGYDITLFNYFGEEEILLEPERKIFIEQSMPEVNEIIFITANILDTPLVLSDSEYQIGLNVGGICENSDCKSHNQEVFCKIGLNNIDLVRDCDEIKCPICLKEMEPLICKFYRCHYKITGKKKVNGKTTKVNIDWKKVENDLDSFDQSENGKANWLILMIETKPL